MPLNIVLLSDDTPLEFVLPDNAEVKLHPYRTARLLNQFIRVPREAVRSLESALAIASRKSQDNHVVYEIIYPDGSTFYVMFSDFTAYFGVGIEARRW